MHLRIDTVYMLALHMRASCPMCILHPSTALALGVRPCLSAQRAASFACMPHLTTVLPTPASLKPSSGFL
eukprot:1136908-Pelagomonas_calceolata.AAC.5